PVATDGQNLAAELTVYPNPNAGSFKIQCIHPIIEAGLRSLDGTLEIRNLVGPDSSLQSPKSWSQFPAGMYYLIVNTTSGKTYKTKVILQPE
ncbi:MAG TPA: T9SS type A sorting domain-containing protein, partial [Saprospiraceae bacterium]|nr:T9SS type A sorting domain-containing protein [Saprospiraceae bacterium]